MHTKCLVSQDNSITSTRTGNRLATNETDFFLPSAQKRVRTFSLGGNYLTGKRYCFT